MSAGHRTPEYMRFIQAERPKWQAQINAGGVPCRRCGGALVNTTRWDLGHIVAMVDGGPLTSNNVWPEHRRCNRSAGAALRMTRTAEQDRRVFKL